ncbi:MAG: oligosaccharide flippase family protein [Bacteroidaceae bacterium]|nr:oligosaccharide flippase family protein [Bacteroidaceae bacterium]
MSQIPSGRFLTKKFFIFGGAQVVSIIATLVRSKVAAITIGTVGMGLSALYLSISNLMSNMFNLGLPDSGVQTLSRTFAENDSEKLNRQIGIIRLWGVLCAIAALFVSVVAAPVFCKLYFHAFTSHLSDILLLSIVPACTIITAIETVVLKALQKTRLLTCSISYSALITVIVSVPLYVFVGMSSIIYVLVLTSILAMSLTTFLSYHANPSRPAVGMLFSKEYSVRNGIKLLWRNSKEVIMLGLAFVITGVGAVCADLLIQMFLTAVASLAVLGFYKVGYQFAISYPAMIFTAVTNDYYPRLSSLGGNVKARNVLVTKQTMVLIMNVIPCIAVFILLLPWIVTLLLSSEFTDIVPMVRIGALAIIVRCFSLPVCFVPLALGRKWDFIIMELFSYIMFVVFVIAGYQLGGLVGIGVGVVATNVFDYVYGYFLCRLKYQFKYQYH